jgi:EAL domain-containing protein (putative c-di-GMP-specific phosphodiesterase class I)
MGHHPSRPLGGQRQSNDRSQLSATSIEASNLVAFIERQIQEEGADPANLVFEITETALMQDITAGMEFARGVREIGCGLALDDFGTGYGSFTYLKNLPLTFVKIDIDFVHDLATNPANRHVVAAIVSLAKAFGLQTIAEGVENEETLTLLRADGVDFAQGFHLGRPEPVQLHLQSDGSETTSSGSGRARGPTIASK